MKTIFLLLILFCISCHSEPKTTWRIEIITPWYDEKDSTPIVTIIYSNDTSDIRKCFPESIIKIQKITL